MTHSWAQRTALLAMMLTTLPSADVSEPLDRTSGRSPSEVKAMLQLLAPSRGASAQDTYLARVRQYRYLCGVPFETLAFNARQGELATAAAGICARLGKLTHAPERPPGMSDADYQLGKDGAGQSNLFSGRTEPAGCVDGWMDDSDQNNIDRVGHRRWILNPSMGTSAFGTEGNYAAMYAFDGSLKNISDWDCVTYPTRGAMPVQFFGARHAWSISPNLKKYVLPAQTDLTVTIQATNAKAMPQGEALKLDYFHLDTGGFGSGPAVIFRPAEFALGQAGTYVVTLTGLKDKSGAPVTLRYSVNFFNLPQITEGAEGAAVYTRYFQARFDAIQAMPNQIDQVEAYADFVTQEYLQQADPKLRKAAVKSLSDIIKDPVLKREHDALQKYKTLLVFELQAGTAKDKLVAVATGYRDLAKAFKETRAGVRAADDFTRLKNQLEVPGAGGPRS
ncbi:MAG: hypothetical protein H0W78_13305 [Planctomycetes bacterium]|nr:hypothetical protein [Planctomycetota bacterium]